MPRFRGATSISSSTLMHLDCSRSLRVCSTSSDKWSDRWRWEMPVKVSGKQGRPRETVNAGCADRGRRTRAPLPLTLQVVVIGVLGHAAVQEGPGEVVHSVLLVLDGLGDDLGVEVVVHAVVQVRLHWQRLIQELLEEILWERTSMTLQYTVKDSTVTKEGQGQMRPLCNRHGSYKMEAASCTDKVSWVCVPAPPHHGYSHRAGRTPSPAG